MHAPIAITGAGVMSPLGTNAEALWCELVSGQDLRGPWKKRPLGLYPVDNVISIPEEAWAAATSDDNGPSNRARALARFAVNGALAEARLPAPAVPRLGCVLASTTAGVEAMEDGIVRLPADQAPQAMTLDASHLLCAPNCHWTGPISCVSTACSSGLVAPVLAIDMLLAGEADAMIAGGLDVLLEYTICGFNALRVATRDRCRPFSAERRGVVLSEGAACFCFERLDAAVARGAKVKAIIAGYGISCDADHLTAPNIAGVTRAITQALQTSGLATDAVGGIFAHGTGTLSNDFSEVAALRAAFGGDDLPPITSIKSVVGHSQAAAGAFSLLAAVLALERSSLPPTAGVQPLDPELGHLDIVNSGSRPLVKKHLMVNALGFGGNNCVVIVSAPSARSDAPEAD